MIQNGRPYGISQNVSSSLLFHIPRYIVIAVIVEQVGPNIKICSPGRKLVRPPGFEPGLPAWKAGIITRLDYGRSHRKSIVRGYDLRVMIEWTRLGGSVEGFYPDGRSQLPPVFDRSVEGYDPTVRISYSYHI